MRRVQLLDDGRRDTVQGVQVQVVHVGAVGKGGMQEQVNVQYIAWLAAVGGRC